MCRIVLILLFIAINIQCLFFRENELDPNSGFSNLSLLLRIKNSSSNASTVRFEPPGGLYNSFQRINISSSLDNVRIHYTIDGSDPTIDSPLFITPLSIWDMAGRNIRVLESRNGEIVGTISGSGFYKYPLLRTGAGNLTSYTLVPNEDGLLQKGIARSYTGPTQHSEFTGDITTTDNSTGLIWKTCVQGILTPDCSGGGAVLLNWQNAQTAVNGCDSLNSLNGGAGYAGLNDWKLPTIDELESIKDFGSEAPAKINSVAFPNSPGGPNWSRTDSGTSAYTLNFSLSSRGFIGKSSNIFPVRCVSRSGQNFRGYQFTDNGDGTIEELRTGSIWQKCLRGQDPITCANPSVALSWGDSLNYCDTLELAGRSNWRLPNRFELGSLMDYRDPGSTLIDPKAFPNLDDFFNWTSTTSSSLTTTAWRPSFQTGEIPQLVKSNAATVRCISDP